MTKNILKSFFLVTLASLLLFSCTNVNDPTAVLESNGVLKTNTLRGVSLKNLPSALDGQDVVIKINNNEVGKVKPVDGTLEVILKDAKFDAFTSENVVTIQGMGSDKVTYKFGKFVDDTLALQYNYEFVEAGYSATEEPSFILTIAIPPNTFKGISGIVSIVIFSIILFKFFDIQSRLKFE